MQSLSAHPDHMSVFDKLKRRIIAEFETAIVHEIKRERVAVAEHAAAAAEHDRILLAKAEKLLAGRNPNKSAGSGGGICTNGSA